MLNSHSNHDWQTLYGAALLEVDPGKLPERIIKARKAISTGLKKT
jgi:hypothetical protein